MASAVRKMLSKIQSASVFLLSLLLSKGAYAIDSYRYLHITIDTVWNIFLFLLIGIFVPFIVMIWLYWRYAMGRTSEDGAKHRENRREATRAEESSKLTHEDL